MSTSTIVTMLLVNAFVMGGFLYFLYVAIRNENKKNKANKKLEL